MSENSAPAVLASFPHELEASLLVNELQNRDINARMSGEMVSGFRAEAPGDVAVLVPIQDMQRAREILHELRNESSDIDWSKIDVGEPDS